MGALISTFQQSPQGMAGSSMQFGQAAMGMQAAGDIFQGFGGFSQAMYAAQVAQNNAATMRNSAANAIMAGGYEESASKMRTGQMIGAEKAAQGANNVDVGVGSAAGVRQSTATIGAMDALMIRYNATKAAFGMENEANAMQAQAQLDKMAGVGALAGGAFKAAGSILSGAAGLGAKWSQQQQAFG